MIEKLDLLIAQHQKGFTLPQEFYSDPQIYNFDIDRIHMRHWLCVGHASRIPTRGDYFLFDFAGESLIIVRTGENEIRALANVCAHRGSHVCYEKEGKARAFVCPYHGWGYNLDGSLRSARLSGSDFDVSQYRLKEVQLRVVEGAIFVSCADSPPDFSEAEEQLGHALRQYGWGSAKIAHRANYIVDGNWKLVTENYMECYHCSPAHPEFSRNHAAAKPFKEMQGARDEVVRRAEAMGISIPDVDHWPWADGAECYYSHRDATMAGYLTGSEDGQALAPFMGEFKDFDGGFTYFGIGPSSFFLNYPDHSLIYLFRPLAAQKTEMEVIWLVRGDAREGEDYDLDRLTWMWNVTTIADKSIIDHNQQGVNSRFYKPGPYQEMESLISEFVEWYLNELKGDT